MNNIISIESESLFSKFINALAIDATKYPQKLRNFEEVWDKEWDELLGGIKMLARDGG